MACKIDLRDRITAEANSQGVPPAIALAVATQETRICHWRADGTVIRGSAGEYGVFQLLPSTAAALGVDPTDVDQNIHGGVLFLSQLFDRYSDWGLAVQHYNGSGPAARAYAQQVLAIARNYGFALNAPSAAPSTFVPAAQAQTPAFTLPAIPSGQKNVLIALGLLGGAGLLVVALRSEERRVGKECRSR